jgi:hypothetical protein
LQYWGVDSAAFEMNGMLDATTAPNIGSIAPAAFLKKLRREITSFLFSISKNI